MFGNLLGQVSSDVAAAAADPLSLVGGVVPLLIFVAVVAGVWLIRSSNQAKPGGGSVPALPASPPGSLAAVLADLSPKLHALESSLAALGVNAEAIAKQADGFVVAKIADHFATLTAAKAPQGDGGKAVQS